MGGKALGGNKTRGRRKQDEISSLSSENSQGMPEPQQTDNNSRMADMTEDDVVTVTARTQQMELKQDPTLRTQR